MKEKKGYKRKLIEKKHSEWTNKVYRTWEYTWSDGTKSKKTTVKYW